MPDKQIIRLRGTTKQPITTVGERPFDHWSGGIHAI